MHKVRAPVDRTKDDTDMGHRCGVVAYAAILSGTLGRFLFVVSAGVLHIHATDQTTSQESPARLTCTRSQL